MADFHGDQACTTHHACDCILAERDRLRAALKGVIRAAEISDPIHREYRLVKQMENIARDALSEGAPDG